MHTNDSTNPVPSSSDSQLNPITLLSLGLLVSVGFAFMVVYSQQGSTGPKVSEIDARRVSAESSSNKSGPHNNGGSTGSVCATDWSCTQGATYPINYSGEVSVAVDDNEYPHVGTIQPIDSNTWQLEYSYMDTNGWHTETVMTRQTERPLAVSLHLDTLGAPHILVDVRYNSDVTNIYTPFNRHAEIYHVYKDINGWNSELVVAKSVLSTEVTLFQFLFSSTLDTADRLHVVYFDRHADKFIYAYQDVTGWRFEDLENAREWNYYQRSSITTDVNNQPHILLNKVGLSDSRLVYTYKTATGWQNEDLGGNIVFHDNQIVLDAANRPHILYTQGSYYNPQLAPPESIVYAYKDVNGWHREQIETDRDGYIASQLALDLDSSAYPHIAYNFADYRCKGDPCGELVYHYKDVSGWHRGPVERATVARYDLASRGVDIAMSDQGRPHLVYTGSSVSSNLAGGFRYATR